MKIRTGFTDLLGFLALIVLIVGLVIGSSGSGLFLVIAGTATLIALFVLAIYNVMTRKSGQLKDAAKKSRRDAPGDSADQE
jgi:heme exporter protein D